MAADQHELALCARQCPAHHSGATEGAPPSHLDLLLSPLVIARRLYHDPAPPAAGAAAAGEGSAAAAQGARRRHALPLPGACTGRNNRGRCVGTPGTGAWPLGWLGASTRPTATLLPPLSTSRAACARPGCSPTPKHQAGRASMVRFAQAEGPWRERAPGCMAGSCDRAVRSGSNVGLEEEDCQPALPGGACELVEQNAGAAAAETALDRQSRVACCAPHSWQEFVVRPPHRPKILPSPRPCDRGPPLPSAPSPPQPNPRL